jgi:fatty acid desaturase
VQEVFARREVISSARLRDMCRPSDFRGACQALSHVGALAVSGTLLWWLWGGLWAVPIFMLHGILLNFLYAGQHELSHWTVFRTAWLNEWVGRVFGFCMFYPRTFDQLQHIAHHRYTQDWSRDGELVRPRYTLGSYLWWMSGVTYWYTRWRRIVRFSCGVVTEPYIAATRRGELVREARWHSAGYIAIAMLSLWLRSWVAVILWLAPLLLMKFVHQMQNSIEHLGLSHAGDVLRNTRSTRTNAVMRWMAWQMQYHTAHHAFPGVPFHRLRELHTAVFTERGATPPSMSYLGFQWAVLRAFGGGRTEADYPDDAAWIGAEGVNSHSS